MNKSDSGETATDIAEKTVIWVATFIVTAVGLLAVTWGSPYSVPDLSETRHGPPLAWGRHTTVAIAGPVDRWTVDLTALTVDVALWLLAAAGVPLFLVMKGERV